MNQKIRKKVNCSKKTWMRVNQKIREKNKTRMCANQTNLKSATTSTVMEKRKAHNKLKGKGTKNKDADGKKNFKKQAAKEFRI
jgi:hypothetical protein